MRLEWGTTVYHKHYGRGTVSSKYNYHILVFFEKLSPKAKMVPYGDVSTEPPSLKGLARFLVCANCQAVHDGPIKAYRCCLKPNKE